MATVTPGKIFTSNEVVTPTTLNQLGVPTVSNIVTDDIVASAVTTAKIADGAVTQAKLNAGVTLVPTGAVMPFAMNSAPSGWLPANGAEYAKTGTYANLFAAIGTIHGETNGSGGAGTSHFQVPDLRGYFVRGAGTNIDGIASGEFGSRQLDAVITHTHSGTTGNDSPDHTHTYSKMSILDTGNDSPDGSGKSWSSSNLSTSGASTRHQHPFTTSIQSPAGATETRPRNIALLYCIKF